MYRKERKKKFKTDIKNWVNWTYKDDEDYFICPNNQKVNFIRYSTRNDHYGYKRDFKIYECEDCLDCPLRSECTTTKGDKKRQVHYTPTWEELKHKAKSNLESEEGKEIYRQRKIDVEPVFGQIKANLGFTRFHLRGITKVLTESNLVFMANNLKKLALLG